jgi:hypothetical protein
MTKQVGQQSVIESWIIAIIADGGVERFDDLHIDKVDYRWAHREHWVSGGLEAFQLARRLRDQYELALTVALAYSLESDDRPTGINFATPDEFQAQLDWSPPSLYLFDRDHQPWALSAEVAAPLDASTLSVITPVVNGCYYIEFKQSGSAEYSRTVFVTG